DDGLTESGRAIHAQPQDPGELVHVERGEHTLHRSVHLQTPLRYVILVCSVSRNVPGRLCRLAERAEGRHTGRSRGGIIRATDFSVSIHLQEDHFMRRLVALFLVLQFFLPAFGQNSPSTNATILGFTSASASTERGWEEKFKAIPSPEKQREYMQLLSARPHHVVSPYDKQNAEWILS